jgi:Fic family protein
VAVVEYRLITDIPEDIADLESPVRSSAAAWSDRRRELQGNAQLDELNQRMRRRWAIETGLIEGLYSLDRGLTQLLIDRGLHSDLISHGDVDVPPDQLVAHLHDHAEVYDWLFEFVAQERPFGTSWINELYQLLTRNQHTTEAVDNLGRFVAVKLQKGTWKVLPNNPTRPDGSVHVYCPPELVASEMDRLVEWHRGHLRLGIAPEVQAAWLHHRFTQIHPFQDGNGRVARAIASLVLIRAGRFPLSVSAEEKADYIGVLERADAGDLVPFVDFLALGQRRLFHEALAIADQLGDETELFNAGFAKARRAREQRTASYDDAKTLADLLTEVANDELSARRADFNQRAKAAGVLDEHRARVFLPPEEKRHYYRLQIETVAAACGYFANLREYKRYVRLTIVSEAAARRYVLLVSLHASGRSWKGTMTALGLLQVIERGGEEVDEGAEGEIRSEPVTATTQPFDFGFLDVSDHVVPRFREWLHEGWLSVLKQWEDAM